MDKLQIAYDRARAAENELKRELAKRFPEGTAVAFTIMSDQKNMSTGKVISHGKDGYLRVRHDQARQYSRYSVRSVHFQSAHKL